MKNKLSQNVTYWLGVVAIGLVVGVSLQFVRAWTEPAVAPPGGNIGAPINTGNLPQQKIAGLAINAGEDTNGDTLIDTWNAIGLLVPNGNVGIGTATPGQKLDVAGTAKTQKLQLGGKWLFSGVGDAHANDEWLRMMNKDGTDYYGGIAADKFWAGSQICLSGDCRSAWPAGISTGLYGSCKENRNSNWILISCVDALSPAYCSGSGCACPGGYIRIATSDFSDNCGSGISKCIRYTCYKQ